MSNDELMAAKAELEDVLRKKADKRLGEAKLLELDARANELHAIIAEEERIIEFPHTAREPAATVERSKELLDAPILKIKPLRLTKTPVTAYTGDAGLDLEFAPADGQTRVVRPGSVEMLETGVAVAIPEGYAGLVLPRSGMATKRGLRPVNTPGLIDAGFRGEVMVALEAVLDRQIVVPGERIAQLVIVPVLTPTVQVVRELDVTERGRQGFGSSD